MNIEIQRPKTPSLDEWEDLKQTGEYQILKKFLDKINLSSFDLRETGSIKFNEIISNPDKTYVEKVQIIAVKIYGNSLRARSLDVFPTELSSDEIIQLHFCLDIDKIKEDIKLLDEYKYQLSLKGQKFRSMT